MAKIPVILNCRWDNGKTVKQPGETISLEKKEAEGLAWMGLVQFPQTFTAKPARTGTVTAREEPQPDGPDDASDLVGLEPEDLVDGEETALAAELDPDALDETQG